MVGSKQNARQEQMTNNPTTGASPKGATTERRSTRRCKINQLMRLRPSDPERKHFEDLRSTMSVSRTGVFFQSSETGYEVGMRLFMTLPYSHNAGATNREYLAEVVRKDLLPNGLFGIGAKILMEKGIQHGYSFESPMHSKQEHGK
ncbi:MAG: hypothetical protein NVS9B4_24390 [Candidatus Acidiferrum sp.]